MTGAAKVDELRAALAEATPEPWKVAAEMRTATTIRAAETLAIIADAFRDADARYIAAANPKTIAALLADNDRLRTALLEIASDLDDADYPAIKASRMRNIARAALERSPE